MEGFRKEVGSFRAVKESTNTATGELLSTRDREEEHNLKKEEEGPMRILFSERLEVRRTEGEVNIYGKWVG